MHDTTPTPNPNLRLGAVIRTVRYTDTPLIQLRFRTGTGYGNLQGWKASSQIRTSRGQLIATALASIKTDTTSNYLEFDYPQSAFLQTPDGVYRWDCFYQSPGGRIQAGPWEFFEIVTWATAIPPDVLVGGTAPSTDLRPIYSVVLNDNAALPISVQVGAAVNSAILASGVYLDPVIAGRPATVQGLLEELAAANTSTGQVLTPSTTLNIAPTGTATPADPLTDPFDSVESALDWVKLRLWQPGAVVTLRLTAGFWDDQTSLDLTGLPPIVFEGVGSTQVATVPAGNTTGTYSAACVGCIELVLPVSDTAPFAAGDIITVVPLILPHLLTFSEAFATGTHRVISVGTGQITVSRSSGYEAVPAGATGPIRINTLAIRKCASRLRFRVDQQIKGQQANLSLKGLIIDRQPATTDGAFPLVKIPLGTLTLGDLCLRGGDSAPVDGSAYEAILIEAPLSDVVISDSQWVTLSGVGNNYSMNQVTTANNISRLLDNTWGSSNSKLRPVNSVISEICYFTTNCFVHAGSLMPNDGNFLLQQCGVKTGEINLSFGVLEITGCTVDTPNITANDFGLINQRNDNTFLQTPTYSPALNTQGNSMSLISTN